MSRLGWDEGGRLVAGNSRLEQLVDLLERKTLGLDDNKVGEGKAEETAGAPDKEDSAAEIGVALAGVDKVRSGIGDTKVPEL